MIDHSTRADGQPADLTKVDVLRVLRERLDSIISGIDDDIAHGGQPGHPPLAGAGLVCVGRPEYGYVLVSCQDSLGIVVAKFTVDIDVAREYGLLDGDGAA